MGTHAVRNASGAKRWMSCPGSLNLVDRLTAKGVVHPTSSHFARQGTAAHGLAEESLRRRIDPSSFVGGVVYLDGREDAHVMPPLEMRTELDVALLAAWEAGGWEAFPIDADMADAVAVYYRTVLEDLEAMGPHAELSVERRFDLSHLVGYDWGKEPPTDDPSYSTPSGLRLVDGRLVHSDGRPSHGPMFGTNDASVFLPFDLLRVYDYKHGRGVVVEVEENVQEMYYALGMAEEVGWAFGEVELVIVQPRAAHSDGPVRRWRCDVERLKAFKEELRLAALATEDPDAPIVAGDHCTFCPAAAYCPALKERAFGVARLEFQAVSDDPGAVVLASTMDPGPSTSEDDLRTSLEAIPMLDAFIKAVEGEAMRRLRETPGGEAFGHKLVRKRSVRNWLSEVETEEGPADAFEHLVALGFPQEALFEEPKRKGPAKVEALRPPELLAKLKAAGVKAPAAWIKQRVAELTFKPEGGVTIAHSSDPRPAVDPSAAAAADFEEVEE